MTVLTADERAELEALRDVTKRLLNFGDDDSILMPWIDAHRLHADEPYIGCPFCRPQSLIPDLDLVTGEQTPEVGR